MFLNFLAITISRQSSTQTCTHTHKHAHTHPFLSNASCQINIFFTSLTGADKCSKASTHTHKRTQTHISHESLMDKKERNIQHCSNNTDTPDIIIIFITSSSIRSYCHHSFHAHTGRQEGTLYSE